MRRGPRKSRIGRRSRLKRFISDVLTYTPLLGMILLMIVLWLTFSVGLYLTERGVAQASIDSFGGALYWATAAFSTAGIADTPRSGWAQLIGGVWIVIGSALFFGTIVSTITTYFMRPLQRPVRQIVNTIEYNLEQLEHLSIPELELLKQTTDTLIGHVERLRASHDAAERQQYPKAPERS